MKNQGGNDIPHLKPIPFLGPPHEIYANHKTKTKTKPYCLQISKVLPKNTSKSMFRVKLPFTFSAWQILLQKQFTCNFNRSFIQNTFLFKISLVPVSIFGSIIERTFLQNIKHNWTYTIEMYYNKDFFFWCTR